MGQRKQRMAIIAAILFLISLALMTFFSNTLQSITLPKVSTENPVNKPLLYPIKASGTLMPKHKSELISEIGWKVKEVNIQENELVKKGQTLITFDSEDTEQQLLDEETRLKKQKLSREVLYENLKRALQNDDEEAIRKWKRDLELDRLDTEMIIRKIENLRKNLKKNKALLAPYDGRVTALKAEENKTLPPGQTLLTLVKTDNQFEFSFTLNEARANLLQIKDTIPITVQTADAKPLQIEGSIQEIKDGNVGSDMKGGAADPSNQQRIIVVAVTTKTSLKIQGGEQGNVTMKKQSTEQGMVIRKAMLKKDGEGDYVFVVREKKSPLGNTHYVEKVNVTAGDENGEDVLILKGLGPIDDIVVEASEPLQAGNRVRIL